jgi:hypothetical protein
MARGNDAQQAGAELQANYGAIPNAEDLIAAHRATVDPHVVAAQLKPVDEEATADLDLKAVDVPEGHKVLTGAVRGDSEIYVVRDDAGGVYKLHQPVDPDDYEAPALDPGDEALRAAAKLQQQVEADVAGVKAEVDKELAEAQAAANEKLTKAREEAQAKYQEKVGDAMSEAAEEAGGEPAEAAPKRGAAKRS